LQPARPALGLRRPPLSRRGAPEQSRSEEHKKTQRGWHENSFVFRDPTALQEDRISAGHAEGLFEAWSNLYHRFALAMEATDRRDREALQTILHPDIHAGIEGVRWVENCVRSADAGGIWVDYC
jgi:hypothetical protein